MAHKPYPNLFFSFLIRYFTLGRVPHFQTLYITIDPSKEEPRHFLIYRYIAECKYFKSVIREFESFLIKTMSFIFLLL